MFTTGRFLEIPPNGLMDFKIPAMKAQGSQGLVPEECLVFRDLLQGRGPKGLPEGCLEVVRRPSNRRSRTRQGT